MLNKLKLIRAEHSPVASRNTCSSSNLNDICFSCRRNTVPQLALRMHKTFLSFGAKQVSPTRIFPGWGGLINQVIALTNGASKTMNLIKWPSSFTGVPVSFFFKQLLRLIDCLEITIY